MSDHAALKADIRVKVLKTRDALTVEERLLFSKKVATFADQLPISQDDIVSAFLPIRSEIDLMFTVERLWSINVTVCLPALLDKEHMEFRGFSPDTEIVPNGFGTRAPSDNEKVLLPTIMLMPLAAFDGHGNRIGYGAGHYDRAIAQQIELGQKPKLIGVAFSCQEVEHVPAEPHDVPLDMILTEHGLRSF